MKGVIHDWPDDDPLKILQNIRRVIPPGGTLVLVESLVDSKARALLVWRTPRRYQNLHD